MTCSGQHQGCLHASKASKEPVQKAQILSGSGRFQQLSVRVRVFTRVCKHMCTHHIAVQAVPMAAPPPAASGFSAGFSGAPYNRRGRLCFVVLIYVVDDPCF